MPVVRQLRCGQCGVVAERQLGMGGEAHRHTLVQGGPLPRQEVAVHGLVAEGVAERVVVARGHHQLLAHRLAQRIVDRHRVGAGDLAQQCVAEPPPDDRGDAQQLPCLRVGAGDALEDEVADRGRQVVTATGGDELLDEERVALGAGG